MSITDEIKDHLDIVEVISEYVSLKKAGHNYKGLCPFHHEKTPSFVVFPDSQSWHCFGACSTGGDVFTFIMKRENLDFGEALEFLARKAGIELQPRNQPAGDEGRLGRLREVVADAASYFHYLLNRAGEAEIARSYLKQRGMTTDTWEGWQLGYALDSWDVLKDRLVGKGYTLEEIAEAGLIIQREDGSGFYDRFRGRLMIPIRDVRGRTIGFGARILREDPNRPQPKYINSPQTPLFDKSNVLFGLDMARKAIRDADLAVIVEGYMDVLGSHQVGVRNVVAGMGTALTESQLRRLKRYSSNITLALDPDAAGDHATLRGIETARQTLGRNWEPVVGPTGLIRQESRLKAQLRVATLPEGLDPDELALSDANRWRQIIADATPIVDYYLAIVAHEEDLSSAWGKANAVERMAPLIREIANPIERAHYTQLLARLVQTDERLIAEQVRAWGRGKGQRTGRPSRPYGPAAQRQGQNSATALSGVLDARPPFGLEEYILGHLLLRPDLLAQVDAELISQHVPPLNIEDFANTENQATLTVFQSTLPLTDNWELDEMLSSLPTALQDRWQLILDRVRHDPLLTDEKLTKDLGDSLLRLRARNLRQQVKQIESLIMESEQTGDNEQLQQYRELILAYTAQKRHIQRLLNARSMAGALAQSANQNKT